MKPIDYRNTTWEQVRQLVDAMRLDVYRALEKHGPCTTRGLAAASGIDLLSLRPRVTELYQLGLVELAFPEREAGEGVYRHVPWVVAQARYEAARAKAIENQLTLF